MYAANVSTIYIYTHIAYYMIMVYPFMQRGLYSTVECVCVCVCAHMYMFVSRCI